jgi:glycosyltransferase involved in cell wall biosynthesis
MYNGVDPLTAEEILLAEAIIKLLKDESLRVAYSVKSLERASEFELTRCIDKYEKCLYAIDCNI